MWKIYHIIEFRRWVSFKINKTNPKLKNKFLYIVKLLQPQEQSYVSLKDKTLCIRHAKRCENNVCEKFIHRTGYSRVAVITLRTVGGLK